MTADTNALAWWHAKKALRGSRNEWWARAGCGRYVVALYGDYWNVHYQPWPFGGGNSAWPPQRTSQGPIAQADYDLARATLTKVQTELQESAS